MDRAKEMPPQGEGSVLRNLEQHSPEPLFALTAHLPFNAVHQQFKGLRHHQHGRDLAFLHGARQDGGLPAGGIGHAGAGVKGHKETPHLFVHVAEGQNG